MAIIVSFVNQTFTPELKLGILDEALKFRWILGDLEKLGSGITGIAEDKQRLYCAIQKVGIAVLDKKFNVVQLYEHNEILDPHSIINYAGDLYVVSSGNNSIHQLSLYKNGKIKHSRSIWKSPDTHDTYDQVHLNSLVAFQGVKYASQFGFRKPHQKWSDVSNGCIINISDNSIVLNSLNHPHTLFQTEEIIFCESRTGSIKNLKGKQLYKTKGYIRGLTLSDDYLYLGVSARRKLSKSRLGKLSGRIDDFEEEEVTKCKIDILHPASYELISSISMHAYGNEIYDLFIPKSFTPDLDGRNICSDPVEKRVLSMESNFIGFIKKGEEELEKAEKAAVERNKENVVNLKKEIQNLQSRLIYKTELDKKVHEVFNRFDSYEFEKSLNEINAGIQNSLQKNRDIQARLKSLLKEGDAKAQSALKNEEIAIDALTQEINRIGERIIEVQRNKSARVRKAIGQDIKELKDFVREMNVDKESVLKVIKESDSFIRSNIKNKEELENRIGLLQKGNKDLSAKIVAYEAEINVRSQTNDFLQNENTELKTRLDQFSKDLSSIGKELANRVQLITDLNMRIDHLTNDHNKINAQLQERLLSISNSHAALSQNVKILEKSKVELSERNKELEEKLTKTEQSLNQNRNKVSLLESELASSQKSNQKELERLELSLVLRDESIQKLQQILDISDQKVVELSERNEVLFNNLSAKEAEAVVLEAQIGESNMLIQKIDEELSRIKSELNEKTAHIELMEVQATTNEEERKRVYEMYEQELKKLQKDRENLKRRNQEFIKEVKNSYTWKIGSLFIGIAKFLGVKEPLRIDSEEH